MAVQELLDDLQGLSGDDESFVTAASQHAAELSSDAQSRPMGGTASGQPGQRSAAPADSSDARLNSPGSPATGTGGARDAGCQLNAAVPSGGAQSAAGLFHLPAELLNLVLLQLQPRDW